MSFWKGRNLFKHIEVVPGGTFKGFGLVDTNSRVYYVNNITGASGAGGLSWNDAFAEPSQAITAAEAFRELGGLAPAVSTNDYILPTIVIQGTETAYAGITHLASYCRMIGLGANPYGNVTGIPRLGADNITTVAGGGMTGAGPTGDVGGAYISGIQWQCNDTTDCFQIRNIYRTTIEDCAFFTAGWAVGTTTSGFNVTDKAGGLVVRDCHWGTNASRTAIMWYGFLLEGTYFNNCRVENCTIAGRNAAIRVEDTLTYGQGSVFKNCFVGDLGHGACAVGIQDETSVGTISYQNIMINADDPIAVTNDNSRFVGCVAGTAYVVT